MQNPKCGKPQWVCVRDCNCCETREAHPRKLRKITNKNHGNCEHDKTRCSDPPHKHACNTGTLESSHKDKSLPRMGTKFRAAQNAVLQTRLQTKLQTKLQTGLQTNNAGNQTHSAATLFSARSSAPHTSSSRSSNLSPPQDVQS